MPDGRQWRIVFMGTPEFALPSLSSLASTGKEVVAVVTQPDRPRGRGRKLSPPPVKVLAQELSLPIWQPEKIRDPAIVSRLADLAPDLFVVVAYGQILPPALLGLPRLGALNVHASLLPAYRGPAPINWAIINGETQTGVTTMFMDQGVDTGAILESRIIPIKETDTAKTLHDRLSKLGADLLIQTIAGLKDGTVSPHPQPEAGASHAPLLTKSDGLLNWSRPAVELARLIRGLDPWPGAWTAHRGRSLKLFGGRTGSAQGLPGQVLGLDTGWLHVAAGEGSLLVAELQLAGQKRLAASEFWHGQRLEPGVVLGT
ncbi:MAG: methionyl-tRNA formyltransferase [Deltaproteobacteria bacterium]|nr:methionyl-tRNA formyltransferase [Deltaproteobacteria bacterium]